MLREVAVETFIETFSSANAAENLHKYLSQAFSPEKLLAEVRCPESEFYFAAQGDQIAGYLKINFGDAQTELSDPRALEIERIYVRQTFYGCGIGQKLLEKALQRARDRKLNYIWLGVWEKNERAIRFYQKHGFVAFDKHFFRLGDDVQTDILMRLTLA